MRCSVLKLINLISLPLSFIKRRDFIFNCVMRIRVLGERGFFSFVSIKTLGVSQSCICVTSNLMQDELLNRYVVPTKNVRFGFEP